MQLAVCLGHLVHGAPGGSRTAGEARQEPQHSAQLGMWGWQRCKSAHKAPRHESGKRWVPVLLPFCAVHARHAAGGVHKPWRKNFPGKRTRNI